MSSVEENETLIERAIEEELPISFRYWPEAPQPNDETPPRRTVSPYEFKEGKNGKTLLVCWSHGSEGIRTFNLERIGGVRSEAEVEDFVSPVERG